ncbi:MAG TPA: hypothetical protein EYP08_04385, partial [Pyrodictiaceae archaeon]|nr:hypothetical protein [Pyrodictiaceae archaeon]
AYGMGRRAMAYFQSLGIQVVTGAYGKISDVIEAFMNQALKIDNLVQVGHNCHLGRGLKDFVRSFNGNTRKD